jgi:hypothetical protein
MRLRALRHIGDPHPIIADDISVILAEGDNGTALAVVVQYEPKGGLDGVVFAHAGEDDFNTVLRNLGFNKFTICENLGDLSMTREQAEAMPKLA